MMRSMIDNIFFGNVMTELKFLSNGGVVIDSRVSERNVGQIKNLA